MERVAFLVEPDDEPIRCLLNPETMVVRRRAGVRPRRSAGGKLTADTSADDPLLYTGGGTTELTLDLLFDVDIAGISVETTDVRDLTRPFWALAESRRDSARHARPPLARFVWGKAWNIPGVVAAVAERLERFDSGGAPQRSWLRMRFLRVTEEVAAAEDRPVLFEWIEDALEALRRMSQEAAAEYELRGDGSDEGSERLDELAFHWFGDPAAWRLIAAFNGLLDPLSVLPNTRLRVPPVGRAREGGTP